MEDVNEPINSEIPEGASTDQDTNLNSPTDSEFIKFRSPAEFSTLVEDTLSKLTQKLETMENTVQNRLDGMEAKLQNLEDQLTKIQADSEQIDSLAAELTDEVPVVEE